MDSHVLDNFDMFGRHKFNWYNSSESDPLAELVRALAHDSEWAINPGSNTNGVVGAGALHYKMKDIAARKEEFY